MEHKQPTHSSAVPALPGFNHGSGVSHEQVGPAETPNPLKELRLRERWIQTFDVNGTLWEVREARPTKHDFDLLFGRLVDAPLGSYMGGGPNRLIVTPALLAYWEVRRFQEGETYDLPAGRTTIKRVRQRLKFNFFRDRSARWRQRLPDLKILPIREFAKRYDVPIDIAKAWRFHLLGRSARLLNWWHDPAVLEVLLSGKTLRAIGETLGISTSQVHRLRSRAQEFTSAPAELKPAA